MSTGTQAVELMSHLDFDMCRAIKKSKRLETTRAIMTTSVFDSGQVPEDVLQSHAARIDHEAVRSEAISRYHGGDIEGAIQRLRGALVTDPSSP